MLHGGGNTSVKVVEHNLFDEEEEILYVKGSGSKLSAMTAEGFTPLRYKSLARLMMLDSLPDAEWKNQIQRNVTVTDAPAPSVETLLHAIFPYTFVNHTHPDALLAISSTPSGEERIRELYGDSVVIVPYARSGFPIAKLSHKCFAEQSNSQTVGVFLMNHGLFTFGDTAKAAYDRTIEMVAKAEQYLDERGAWNILIPPIPAIDKPLRYDIAAVRQELSEVAGAPLIVTTHTDPQCLSFSRREDIRTISQQGPATPDHVIRTKNKPLIGVEHVQWFREDYERYFKAHASSLETPLPMLDPAPRVIIDPDYGMLTTGRTAKDATIAGDIYRNTMDIILRATALEAYQALPEDQIFEMEYWALEQAKLDEKSDPPFKGEVVLITGAASGIGKACVDSFMERGAAVVGLDINPSILTLKERNDFVGIRCDVTEEEEIEHALERAVRAFGGIDMMVLNAGIFPGGKRIDSLPTDEWRKVMRINLDSNLILMREAYPFLVRAPRGGRVSIIGSKNVPAPGPGAVAYSSSKAALNQMARVAALEWGKDGIRINSLHPNAVFDTGLWTDEVLQSRAAHYGLTIEQYKRNNVLRTEVKSRHVAELAAEMCGPLFEPITGAQLPVDGGNERVI